MTLLLCLLTSLVAAQAPAAPAAPLFRPAVRAGNMLYLSGALPRDASGKIVSQDIKAQTRQVIENLKAVLEKNGTTLDKVVSVTVFLKRTSDFAAMNEVYGTFWKQDPPARATVVVADLVAPEALLEVSMIATVGQ